MGRVSVSFRVSGDGRRVLGFVGHYKALFCNGSPGTVTDKSIAIRADGSFADTGQRPNHAPDGTVNGMEYLRIKGRFVGRGTTADVFYSDIVRFNSGDPRYRECGLKVKGSARAR